MPQLLIIVAMFALLYALLIRPQRQKQRAQLDMLSKVAPGDEVITVGGLYGIVVEIDEDDDLVLEIAEGIHVRLTRRAVANVIPPDEDEDEDEPEDETEDEAEAEDADAEDEVADDLVTNER